MDAAKEWAIAVGVLGYLWLLLTIILQDDPTTMIQIAEALR